jgi:hypothetical protein
MKIGWKRKNDWRMKLRGKQVEQDQVTGLEHSVSFKTVWSISLLEFSRPDFKTELLKKS